MEITSDFNFLPLMWLVIGIGFIAFEFWSHKMLSIFFGAAALVTALFAFMGIASNLQFQIILFGVLSLVYIVSMRNKFRKQLEKTKLKTEDEPNTDEKDITSDEDGKPEAKKPSRAADTSLSHIAAATSSSISDGGGSDGGGSSGGGRRIRTLDLPVRSRTLYPTELCLQNAKWSPELDSNQYAANGKRF